jgi:hypothetical protein
VRHYPLAARLNHGSSLAAALTPQGFSVENASYQCVRESGKSGAGNPESVSCYYVSRSAQSLLSTATPPPPIFQLDERDILVHLGCTPASPGPLYYGFSPYLYGFDAASAAQMLPGGQLTDTPNHLETRQPSFQNSSKAHAPRCEVFGSSIMLGNSCTRSKCKPSRCASHTSRANLALTSPDVNVALVR